MASTLKVNRIETPDGLGNVSFAQPISGDGAQLTNLNIASSNLTNLPAAELVGTIASGVDGSGLINVLSTPADDSVTGGKIDLSLVAGDIIYSDGTDSIERLPKGTDGEVLTLASGVPSWAAAAGGGKVLQHKIYYYKTLVSFTDQWPNDNTIPQITEGAAVTELAITPVSATSTLYIDYWLTFSRSVHDMGSMALFVDTDVDAIAVSSAQGNTNLHTMQGYYSVVSGSTSARTYKLRAAASPGGAGTMYLHQANGNSWWLAGTIPNSGIRIYEMEA